MKKLKIVLILVGFFTLTGFSGNTLNKANKDQEIKAKMVPDGTDVTSPVISYKTKKDITLIEGSDFDLSDFIQVSDDTGVKAVTSFGKLNLEQADKYTISIVAIDEAHNIATAELNIEVLTQDDYNQKAKEQVKELLDMEITNRSLSRQIINEELEENYTEIDDDIVEFAKKYIGMGGYCNEVAQRFLSDYLGYKVNVFDTHTITYEDARPGDLVEYTNGGKGNWHVGVYLGNGKALHGNWNGTTVIASIWVDRASNPYFERLN